MGLLLHGATRQCERFWGIGSRLNFNFVTVSSAGLVDGVSHELILTGRGTFNSRYVVGGGSWSHSAANTPAPQELISSGIWRATSLTSWTPLNPPNNPFGQIVAGVLEMEVILYPKEGPLQGVELPARLTVVCNVPSAGKVTGIPDGIVLDIVAVYPLTFVPLDPSPLEMAAFTLARGLGRNCRRASRGRVVDAQRDSTRGEGVFRKVIDHPRPTALGRKVPLDRH